MKSAIWTIAFCLPLFSFGQTTLSIQSACNFDGTNEKTEYYTFDGSKEADGIVGEIVDAVHLEKNFVIKSSDCKNAMATEIQGTRYILYNTSFLEKFKRDAHTKWAAYCVLAHEIGHHLNHHNFSEANMKQRKINELNADIFAGGVLFALGASLEEAQAGIEELQSTGETETHPPASARAEAIASGWKKAKENYERIYGNPELKSQKKEAEPVKKKEEPTIQPKEETVPTGKLTQVSDILLQKGMVGNWGYSMSDGFNNQYQQTNLFEDGTGFGYNYINGILQQSIPLRWFVEGGQLVTINQQNSQIIRYDAKFFGSDLLSLTIHSSNGMLTVPVGTIFTLSKIK